MLPTDDPTSYIDVTDEPTEGPRPQPRPTTGRPDPTKKEIWVWSLGRNMNDPSLARYLLDLDADDVGGGAMVKSLGFELKLDSSGTVYGVMLVNDEVAIGLPAGNTFQAYPGRLPGGLNWRMTAAEVVRVLGNPDDAYTAGYGVELSFTYRDVGGYALKISLAARHERDLWTSPMHTIDVARA